MKFYLSKIGILRIPNFSFNKNIFKKSYKEYEIEILEAIYFSSEELFQLIYKKEITNEKIEISFFKYYIRMCSRTIPFGLFTTVYPISINFGNIAHTEKLYDNKNNLKVNISSRVQNELLKIIKSKSKKENLFLNLNNTCYFLKNELRYIEREYSENETTYTLSSVKSNKYIKKVVNHCDSGSFFRDLCLNLVDKEVSYKDAMFYIDNLIKEDVLQIDNSVCYNSIESNIKKNIYKIKYYLKQINENKINPFDRITIYKKIEQILIDYFNINKKNKLFADSYGKKKQINLTYKIKNQLEYIINFLFKLENIHINTNIDKFKKEFIKKYKNQYIPIMEVLDPEIGIGYMNNQENDHEEKLFTKLSSVFHRTQDFEILIKGKKDLFLLSILKKNTNFTKTYNIEKDIDLFLKKDKNNNIINVFDTYSLICNLFHNNKGVLNIKLDSISGSSASNILNRFSRINEEFHSISEEIIKKENTNKFILSEVNFIDDIESEFLLPDDDIREYEIPIFKYNKKRKKIKLRDIFVSINNFNEIVLFVPKLSKFIKPIISSSYNYNRSNLNIFRFLADLQYQGKISEVNFNWGNTIYLYNHFPRLTYKDIILIPEQWHFNSSEINFIKNKETETLTINKWREKHSIPKQVLLVDDDIKLPIDFCCDKSIKILISEVKKNKYIFFEEILFYKTPFYNERGYFNNELIIPIYNDKS